MNIKTYKAFTLIEVLVAVILVGLAIASLLAANSSLTRSNGAGTQMSTAEFLAEQIRELSAKSAFGDLYSLEDTYSPPINSRREQLTDFADYTQQVTTENVSGSNFEQVVTDHSSDFVRVTVKVLLNGDEITSTSWIRANY